MGRWGYPEYVRATAVQLERRQTRAKEWILLYKLGVDIEESVDHLQRVLANCEEHLHRRDEN